jgi:hypothetical protein
VRPLNTAKLRVLHPPAALLQERERRAQRLLLAFVISGLFFMLLPGTFLGVWNLIAISGHEGPSISAAWIQAHGHAQIFGWIGSFILGIGFYSIPKMTGGTFHTRRGWVALTMWSAGVLLRWLAGVYAWNWRLLLPASGVLELAGFLIFFQSVRQHRSAAPTKAASATGTREDKRLPVWLLSVMAGTAGFMLGLLVNLGAAVYVSLYGAQPVFPAALEWRLLALLAYMFIVPTVWGFSARWLPVFLGLRAPSELLLRGSLMLMAIGAAFALAGFPHVAPWFFAAGAIQSCFALNIFVKPERPAKTGGIHPSFPLFVRTAYTWLTIASLLGVCAAYFDRMNGWTGASRHALTVGFIATMVFAIGQRVLPAFAGMRVLYSPRLMLSCLVLLTMGCALRVGSEVLAYEGYWPPAWHVLPISAICELAAVTLFAANLLVTFKQPPAHEMNRPTAA